MRFSRGKSASQSNANGFEISLASGINPNFGVRVKGDERTRIVAQTSQSAVSQGFQPASRPHCRASLIFGSAADLEIGDTADLEVCGTTAAAHRFGRGGQI